MGNRVTIEATKFVTKDGETYGFRMYDDYDQTYYNNHEIDTLTLGDMDLLDIALDNTDERMGEMFSFVKEEEKGIYINDTWYDFDEIKDKLIAVYD